MTLDQLVDGTGWAVVATGVNKRDEPLTEHGLVARWPVSGPRLGADSAHRFEHGSVGLGVSSTLAQGQS